MRTYTVDPAASEERLALALKASRMGIWEWDITTDHFSWSREVKQLFGLKADEPFTFEMYMDMVHPEDRTRIKQAFDAAVTSGREYRAERRIIWRDGSVHWLFGQGKAVFADGKPVRMICTCMNVDAIKRADELTVINKALKDDQHVWVLLRGI